MIPGPVRWGPAARSELGGSAPLGLELLDVKQTPGSGPGPGSGPSRPSPSE